MSAPQRSGRSKWADWGLDGMEAVRLPTEQGPEETQGVGVEAMRCRIARLNHTYSPPSHLAMSNAGAITAFQ